MVDEEPLRLLNIEEIIKPATETEIKQLASLEELSLDEAEELSMIFPDIPKTVIEKHATIARIKEIFLLPKKLQKWRRR